MAIAVFIHKMSEHMASARIVHWLVREGERVEQYQAIMEVETDKAVAELEAPASGILKGIRPGAVDGAQVPVGETIAFIAEPDEEVPVLPPLGPVEAEAEAKPASPQPPVPGRAEAGPLRATPVARRVAKELGVDLSLVTGTGPQGRIKEEDVRAFAASRNMAAPSPAPPETAVEWLDLTPAQRLTGQRMVESMQTAPQFTLTASADMTNALRLREGLMEQTLTETGERLSITAILVKVVAEALKRHPRANASFEDGRIRLYRQIHVGVAVGSGVGLFVPVVKDADQKSLAQIALEIKSFQDKAQGRGFSADELAGGTFTISNLGMYGIDCFNAIVNPPQSAILAVGRMVKMPVALPDDTIALRPMITLSLSVDHRVMDGIQGAEFLSEIKERLEELGTRGNS